MVLVWVGRKKEREERSEGFMRLIFEDKQFYRFERSIKIDKEM